MVSRRAPNHRIDTAFAAAAIVLAAAAGTLAGLGLKPWSLATAALVLGCAVRPLRRLTASTEVDVVSAWDRVRTEIERARRLNSSLVVARLPVRSSAAASMRDLADHTETVLRGGDSVWIEGRSIMVLLTDADREAAQHAVDRVVRRLDDTVTDSVTAAFPGDVLTLGGLFDLLYPPRRVRPLSAPAGRRAEIALLAVDDEQHATG
jgi:hypothetical protein